MKSQKGFVLIEFVIALPLILMLLYGLAETTLQIYRLAKAQAADYMLAVEAQEVLTRITEDLRAAKSYSISTIDNRNNRQIDEIEITYHAISDHRREGEKIVPYKNRIIDVTDTRVYTVKKAMTHGYYVYAQRQYGVNSSPITGGNFFGDTIVRQLIFNPIEDNLLHITLEMESLVTNEVIKLSTAVFMPAYGK